MKSLGYQARYCNQEIFGIMLNVGYNSYKLDNKKSYDAIKRLLSSLNLDYITYKIIFINGVIRLIGYHFICSYSTLTNELNGKKRLSRKHINQHACICNFMGKINIVGGWHAGGEKLKIYDPKSDTSEKRAEMSVRRIDVAFSVFCGKLVVTGGCSRDDRHVQHLTNS